MSMRKRLRLICGWETLKVGTASSFVRDRECGTDHFPDQWTFKWPTDQGLPMSSSLSTSLSYLQVSIKRKCTDIIQKFNFLSVQQKHLGPPWSILPFPKLGIFVITTISLIYRDNKYFSRIFSRFHLRNKNILAPLGLFSLPQPPREGRRKPSGEQSPPQSGAFGAKYWRQSFRNFRRDLRDAVKNVLAEFVR